MVFQKHYLYQLFFQIIYKIVDLFWTYTPKNYPKGVLETVYDNKEVESAFGLEKYRDYFPASALQTPIYFLLRFHQTKTIDFILDFVNKCVEKYANSKWEASLKIDGLGIKDNIGIQTVNVFIDDKTTIKQFNSQSLWNMY